MPASAVLKIFGLLTALAIVALSFSQGTSPPQVGTYSGTVKLLAGFSMVAGSLLLTYSIGATFLRNGGTGAFKALYWASLSSTGAGIAEAASGIMAMGVPLALIITALSFAGAGTLVLHDRMGGT
jgi:hypothetical protein